MKWTILIILVIATVPASTGKARGTSSEQSTEAMSDRKRRDLRGPVKSCTEESTYAGMTDAEGKALPEVHSEHATEYDVDGRTVAERSRNSDGSILAGALLL